MAKINNLELKEGMYISVIGMNIKNDNGLYIVEHDYSIKDKYATCSESICICKVKLNGEKSKSKYRLNFISEKSFTNNEDLQIKIINDLKSAKKEVNEYMKKREGKETIVSFKESNNKLEKGSLIKFVKGYKCGFWGEVYIGTKSVWEVIDCNNRLEIKELGKKGQHITTGRHYSLNGNCLNQILDGEYITVLEKEEILKEEVKTNLKVNKENIATDELIETEEEEVKEIISTSKVDKEDNKNESIEVEKVILNEDKNGIEIYFTAKPSEEVRNNLKSNGFRWSKYNQCWYAKQNENTINFANTFTTQTEEEIKESSEQYKEEKEKELENKLNDINIDDIENYAIDPDLSKRENSVSMFRSKDTNHTQQLQNYLITKQNEVLEVLNNCNNNQIEYTLKMALQRFKRDYHVNYIKQLQHRASNPSWAVTGRSGRDMRRDEKMNNRYNNLLKESLEITNKFDKAISKAKRDIKQQEKEAVKKHFEDNTKDITIPKFNRVKKEYQIGATREIFAEGNNTYKTTMYEYEGYYIFKNWGSFRVYDSTGNELYNTKTQGKLEDAKKWLIYYLNTATKAV